MNILLISYYFPPCGAIGAKRWGEFYDLSKNHNNLHLTVLTANWAGPKNTDDTIYYVGNTIDYTPTHSINKTYKFLDFLKHPTLVMRSIDKSLFSDWYKKSKKWIDNNHDQYDIVVASYGPVASILLGNYAKRKYNIPYVLDLRDLISIQGQKKQLFLIDSIDKLVDRFITRNVDLFLTVSPTCQKKATNFYKRDIFLTFNGMTNAISDSKVNLTIKDNVPLTILYMGTMGINRNPKNILSLLNEYCSINKNCRIIIKFATQDNPYEFLEKEKLDFITIEWLGYLSKNELELEKKASDAFLLLEDIKSDGNENLTGKIFEYILAKKPIMVSCHHNSDIVTLINQINAGKLITSLDDVHIFLTEKRLLDIEKTNIFSKSNQFKLLIEKLKKCIQN